MCSRTLGFFVLGLGLLLMTGSPAYAQDATFPLTPEIGHSGHRLTFSSIPEADLSDDLTAVLTLTFSPAGAFDLHKLGVALNGVKPAFRSHLRRAAHWDGESLVIAIGQLDFGGHQSFASRVEKIQRHGGAVEIWIRSFRAVASAELSFVARESGEKDQDGHGSSRASGQTPLALEWVSTPASLTNSQSAQFAFQSSEPATTRCSLDGAPAFSCVSPVSLPALAQGAHSFIVTAVSRAGKGATPLVFDWTIDLTPPTARIVSVAPAETYTNQTSLTLTIGTSEPVSLSCQLDGAPAFACSSPVVLTGLSEGTHTISVTPTDLAGNVGAALSYSWTIDLTAPNATLTMLSPASLPTSQTSAQLAVASNEAATFSCALDGDTAVPCAVGTPFTVTGLSDGMHTVTATPTDLAGNVGTAVSVSWLVDTAKPVITISSVVPSDNPTPSEALEVYFTVSKSAAVTCDVDDAGPVPCQSPLSLNGLAVGDHAIVLVATDAAGNVSDPVAYEWAVIPPLPVVSLSAWPGFSPTSHTSATFSFSTSEPASFLCSLDNASPSPCVSPWTVAGIVNGPHTISVTAVDASGTAGPSATYSWTVDTTIVLSGISIAQITSTSALVTWTTNVPATSEVLYGQGAPNSFSGAATSLTTSHSVLLTGLQPYTVYTVQAESVTSGGHVGLADVVTFRTLP